MPNLVGIGNSQVPTNAMLGGLAYQDPAHANLTSVEIENIAPIKAKIIGTAVRQGVFVYDTRKDADGGAWRKRTKNASWYNEPLGTADRGNRREFPSVAVIVAEDNVVTIYDGDDPNLSMWMVFRSGGSNGTNMMGRTNEAGACVYMLGGLLCVGRDYFGLHMVNFITDQGWFKESGYDTPYVSPICYRNGGNQWQGSLVDGQDIVNDKVNDICMRVLPNAPIHTDNLTTRWYNNSGLPQPTIAIATDGGLTILDDSGRVIDHGYTATNDNNYFVDISPGGVFRYGARSFGTDPGTLKGNFYVFSYYGQSPNGTNGLKATNNGQPDMWYSYQTGGNATYDFGGVTGESNTPYHDLAHISDLEFVVGSTRSSTTGGALSGEKGLVRVLEPYVLNYGEDTDYQMNKPILVNYIAHDFNSGWIGGLQVGAWLCDIDDTDATHTNVADDWATVGAWTKQSSITITSGGSGTSGPLTISGNGTGSNVYFFNSITVEAYTDYIVYLSPGSMNVAALGIAPATYNMGSLLVDFTTDYNRQYTFNSGNRTTVYFQGHQSSASNTVINGVFIQKQAGGNQDRSVTNYGLLTMGTVPKNPVEDGAEAIAYGPFSSSNYFRQGYNPNLDWDASARWHISFWVNFTQDNAYNVLMKRSAGSGNHWTIETGGTNSIQFKGTGGAVKANIPGDNVFDEWRHIVYTQDGVAMYGYKDGKMLDTNYGTSSYVNALGMLHIGSDDCDNSKLAMVRMGRGGLSSEQVRRIYADEKKIFQKNSKCTLYGTSSATKAIAYDDSTDIVHVGTSSGRSDMSGMVRINNTTQAVTNSISASNGIIAEQ